MNTNFIIYFIIILVCIIIFTLYFYKTYSIKRNNKEFINNEENIINKESFDPYDFKKDGENKPNFVSDYENIDFNKEPNYSYENVTQYDFNRLFESLKKINKEKIELKDKANYNFYTQSTTDDKLRMNLDMISKYVIKILNKSNYYDFNKTNYGDVKVWIDKTGNEEIKYELFLWDKKNYFEIKLWVHVVKFVENNEMQKYGIRDKHYIFQDFNIGLPHKDQIIPLPTEVIITGHFDTGVSSIRENIPSKAKYLYLNQIEVQNSTLIVDYHKDKYPFNKLEVDEKGFSGITDMSLEYINIKKTDHNPYLEKGRKYNEWPTLDEELKFMGQYPSKPPPRHWNEDGLYYYGKKSKDAIAFDDDDALPYSDERLCDVTNPGTRWSKDKEPLQAQFWPSNYTVLSTCGENYWLFDESRSLPGVFVGGGKK